MNNTKTYLKVKDHSVSKEYFELKYNDQYNMLETRPQPFEAELSKYYQSDDYISHTDSKRNWFEKLYQYIKNIALKRKLALINSFDREDKSLLDFGCGTGDFLRVAQKNNWNVKGVEPNSNARAIANTKTDCAVFDSEQLFQFKVEHFQVITLWHVLEHLPNLEKHFKTFRTLLKPDGRLIIAVPNYKSYDAKYYKEYWAAYDVPRHLWHFSQQSIATMANEYGFEIEAIKPMIFDAYYVSLLSEKYKSGYMNPVKAFLLGSRSNLKAKQSGEYSSLIYILKKA